MTSKSVKARTYNKLDLNDEQLTKLKQVWKKVLDKMNNVEPKPVEDKNASNTGTFGRFSLKNMVRMSSSTSNELELKVSGEELKSSYWNVVQADHPDSLVLRYLVARKWNVDDAVKMFLSSLEFFNGEVLRKVQTEGERCIKSSQLDSGAFYFHQTDKEGYLTLYVHAAKNFPSQYTNDEQLMYTLSIMITGYLMVGELGTITVVFDLAGFTMANLDLNYMKTLAKLLSDQYPETLKRVIVHGAPWIFGSVWTGISSFLDPVIKSKVIFTNGDEIKEYIDDSKLPKVLGGSNDYEFKYTPPSDDEVLMLAKDDEYERLTKERNALIEEFDRITYQWIDSGDSEIKAQRDVLADKLAANHQTLWPYIHCKNLYHRAGVITPYDQISWAPVLKSE